MQLNVIVRDAYLVTGLRQMDQQNIYFKTKINRINSLELTQTYGLCGKTEVHSLQI